MLKQEEFLIGCNYWASNAGCFMWKQFDEEVVRKDLSFLAQYGVNCIRIFPTWDDFQPIAENPIPKSKYFNSLSYRVRVNEKILNDLKFPKSGLSEEKLAQFKKVIEIAKEYGIKVIVAFLTGWMSGRRFIPPLLQGMDVIGDPTAVLWACRFISDMIGELKGYDNIIAWEPGNECSCLSYDVNEEQSELWLMAITQTMRLADNTRPIYSGITTTSLQGRFNQRMIGRYVDVTTTHPYPGFTPYGRTEDLHSMRATLNAACQVSYSSSLTGKTCMVEEINTLGPTFLSDDYADDYLERSMMTSFAMGTNGYLWWCAYEQSHLDISPYNMDSLENYLGLAHIDYRAKPVLEKLKDLSLVVKEIGNLPAPKADAVAILPHFLDQWKMAYGAFTIGAQIGRNIRFVYEEDDLPDCEYYILPCITLTNSIPHLFIRRLAAKVEQGAKLLITCNGGGIGEWEYLTGTKVWGNEDSTIVKEGVIQGKQLAVPSQHRFKLRAATAEVLATDQEGEILFSKNKVGKGTVYLFNAPLENAYIDKYSAEDSDFCEVYKAFFQDKPQVFTVDSKRCMVSTHEFNESKKAIMLNNFDAKEKFVFQLQDGYKIGKVLYAEIDGNVIKMQRTFAYVELLKK